MRICAVVPAEKLLQGHRLDGKFGHDAAGASSAFTVALLLYHRRALCTNRPPTGYTLAGLVRGNLTPRRAGASWRQRGKRIGAAGMKLAARRRIDRARHLAR